jgi:hypothetical protein
MATRQTLPANSPVVVRDSAGESQEHSTRNVIDVTGAIDARNPISNVPCRMVIFNGYEVYFQRAQVIFQDDETEKKVAQLRPWLFFYDIPAYRGIANPSVRLRRYAIRLNLSNWLVPENDIPYELISHLRSRGSNCHVIPFDHTRTENLVNTLITELGKYVSEATEEIEKANHNADRTFDTSEYNIEIRGKKYLAHAKLINKRIASLMGDMQAVAERFSIDPNAVRLSGAMTRVNAVRDLITTRCEIISGMVNLARQNGKHSTGEALANAVEDSDGADQTPVGVLADYLEEQGEDMSAYRSAFAEQPQE